MASFALLPQVTVFGSLEWRGGLELASDDERFGGFSGLALSAKGDRLVAISDRGWWLKADLAYRYGRLAGLGKAVMAPILDEQGRTIEGKARNDAEALAAWRQGHIDGRLIVGYENQVRIGVFDGIGSPFKRIRAPPAIAEGPDNQELEALGRFDAGPYAGSFIALSELNRTEAGDIRGWIWGGARAFEFAIKRHQDYAITDLAILPGGDILTVERSYSAASPFPGMAIRRIATRDIADNAVVAPHLIFAGRAPYHPIDNMEGIAVSQIDGETRLTLISDDNYDRTRQRTLVLQFALKP